MGTERSWLADLEPALEIARTIGKAVLLQFHRDECAG